ncbi:bifunctional biotin--[acetyl-CoA-carboxylase] ligase/biotin operon repressor BirA [Vibrio maerlii]|uniref:bifunctional biotin--[acetyl-CoA-carboxylase] ligase/biotin operon repressor BirA n=1 Tax=Vibrio maerlii TaxID=2231648 RepID=UPI000E3B91C9|nr:bifunctional biotin--[acetyl-CoA-carboxylase] ligase/biotin operon repressor BirA [Vibrio maerlii]
MREHKAKLSLLSILSDGQFHSGERLGEQLGISRAAIGKHIQGIQAWGMDIYRVQGKGYRLNKPIELLDQARLESKTSVPISLIPIIDSTNQYLLDKGEECQSGEVCIAEYQAKGRGRRGREWVSPFGSNLYMSMYWQLEAGMAAAMGLSLVIGVSVVEALEQLGVEDVKLKWPNDLYYQDRKLAGILIEMSGQAGGAANLVIGMGMNLSMSGEQGGITQPWVSLDEVLGDHRIGRNQLASAIINAWQDSLEQYEYQGMNGFVERWNRLDNFISREIKLLMGSRVVSGIAQGINEQGAVLIETDKGIESYIGGEISLRSCDTKEQ